MANILLSLAVVSGTVGNPWMSELPMDNENDFNQPDWAQIIETAFPAWRTPRNGCPRLAKIGGGFETGYDEFPTPEEGKFNPCYYTKAFAGLDPMLGGYPTPIDTKYPYEFAAPFFKQPGDGSTHHCPMNAPRDTPVQSCPKVGTGGCGEGVKDCNKITEEFGIGHVPPFVPLAAVKNAFYAGESVCEWFEEDECTIKKSVLDRLVKDTFGTEDGQFIKFTPPKILDDLPATDPKSTYYKLEYLDDPIACADDNCRGPHYCSKEAAEADIWGDFCPYIHTGENSGLYRHPHIALAAFELWIANKCKPQKCPSTWLDSPNGKDYGKEGSDRVATSITWSEMVNNNDPISQPAVPYVWPNSGNGIFPGHELYGDFAIKPAPGSYITKFVAMGSSKGEKEYKQTTGVCNSSTQRTCSLKKSEEECKAECDADGSCYAFMRRNVKPKGWCCLFKGGVAGNGKNENVDCFYANTEFTAAFEDAASSPEARLASLSEPDMSDAADFPN